jgi:hypothetical protein
MLKDSIYKIIMRHRLEVGNLVGEKGRKEGV